MIYELEGSVEQKEDGSYVMGFVRSSWTVELLAAVLCSALSSQLPTIFSLSTQ